MAKTITVVGMGPGGKQYLTIEALERIKKANYLYLRTEKHPIVDYFKSLGIKFESFDNIYDTNENFQEVYDKIVDKLLELCQNRDIVYGVPGSPFVAESTVQKLIHIARNREDIKLEFIAGASFIEAIINVLGKDPVNGLKIIDGLQMDCQKPDTDVDIIVTQVYNRFVASEVKLKLIEYYDDEYEITIIRGAGIASQEKIIKVPLYELDRVDFLDHLTSIFIPKVGNDIKKYKMHNLVDIMKKLRSNEGCPWDRKQDHQSLKPYLIEESYEVLEALEKDDIELLEEELGDLLLQIVFHSQIASENGYFNITDVITGICRKLINRHPHVFGNLKVQTAEKVLINWEEIKRREKEENSYTESLARIPKQLPALMKSYKIQQKAAKVGFDWDNVYGAMEKVSEELQELTDALNSDNKDKIYEEIGDLLFAVVNVARFFKIRPELALNSTIDKFIKRFSYIEQTAKENNQKMEEMTLEEMDSLWNQAKKIEKKY
ncbi:bifunctional methyltransferase/pyrophosphohydrolase YabN [Paramaledivibacter caminithermalis]|uniref:Tetrapyrrole methylase family protein / MazG family protein n=1 Tax=Paramaledivibacter caminithermalis (strain DSM 15212 / CIP 107654 / DViRD3) TaxID=1121301 RepID=A0A1M6QN84_PARC5|nr:nucleoside triphosphate pyrophosphohydrolase [Paramaledivibacter caminithermalis]SHK21618.1 tetrapyrrole methylase family protein / MazG family protein [Paramaledivibacter caminithermalis DSM 15212]